MLWLCAALMLVSFAVSMPVTAAALSLGRRWRTFDSPGVQGQTKAHRRRIPNTGGIGIFWGVAAPLAAGLVVAALTPGPTILAYAPALAPYLPRIHEQLVPALVLLACLAAIHATGLVDDRRPLGPWVKLAVMVAAALAVTLWTDSRLLTLLDARVGGAWLSIALTVVWIAAVTNALNFMDNMDGLSAGVAAIAGACFFAAAVLNQQWLVASVLALLVGSSLGFLVFNFPPARIFMGDGGSLVLGFLLAVMTVRTTYYSTDSGGWYGVLMPVVVLAVPLYDFASVVLIRALQGRSPFVGDLQHFSHRLVNRGQSRRSAVLVIYGFTAVTGLAAIPLGRLEPWQAMVTAAQVVVLLAVLAIFEWSSAGHADPTRAARPDPGSSRAREPSGQDAGT